MEYEKLMIKYDKHVKIKELPLKYGFKGLYKNKKINVQASILNEKER